MKKTIRILLLGLCVMTTFCLCGCSLSVSESENDQYLRIHIRANSNSDVDQEVKYQIRDKVVDYLTPYIANCSTKEEMERVISNNLLGINAVCDAVLREKGFDYVANSKVCNEYFPTRTYGELTLEQGYYDALIVELGEAQGNNWWCVVYPPLCFVNAKEIDGKNFRYKSKIVELIKQWV